MSLASIESDRLHRYLSDQEQLDRCQYCGKPIIEDAISVDYRGEHYHDRCAVECEIITVDDVEYTEEAEAVDNPRNAN